jgi:hypothetical protein
MSKHILSFTLQQLDDNGQVLARRVHSVAEEDPTAGEFRAGILVDTNQATISLPTTQVRQLIFFNTHATAKITVVFTPYGGAEATINKVGPGGALAVFDATAAGTGIGISSLKLTSDTVNGTYECFLGG